MKAIIRLGMLLFPIVFSHTIALAQNPQSALNIGLIESLSPDPYNAKNIKEFRGSNSIKTGKIQITNVTDAKLTVLLYHPDRPGQNAQFIFELGIGSTQLLNDNQNKALIIGNDWGIQFKQKKWSSGIFFVENMTIYNAGIHTNKLAGRLSYFPEEYEKIMPTTRIGNQVWASSNLSLRRFRNGDLIPYYYNEKSWAQATKEGKPAICTVSGVDESCGYLYNWYALTDPRGLSPVGWHIPSEREWEILISNLGGSQTASRYMKDPKSWEGDRASNSFFGAQCGCFASGDDDYEPRKENAFWWSSTKSGNSKVSVYSIEDFSDEVNHDSRSILNGYSVRLVKD